MRICLGGAWTAHRSHWPGHRALYRGKEVGAIARSRRETPLFSLDDLWDNDAHIFDRHSCSLLQEFLFYYEKSPPTHLREKDIPSLDEIRRKHWDPLVKQTYSVWVEGPRGRRKWHLSTQFHCIMRVHSSCAKRRRLNSVCSCVLHTDHG
jgi:hypothetical protein